jgi:hypothetical protein
MAQLGSKPRRHPGAAEGQASAELVAIVPLVVILILALGEAVSAGYAAWSAAVAARAGARASAVGSDVERVAMGALPDALRRGASVDADGAVEVHVRAPSLLPGVPALPVSASASLDPAASDGG